jgi:hypothetical protein
MLIKLFQLPAVVRYSISFDLINKETNVSAMRIHERAENRDD